MKIVVTRLKGHATLWWDGVQIERRRLGKQLIRNWTRLVVKLREKFLPSDYQLSLYRQLQNLKQRLLTVREYTEEFYKVSIRDGKIQDTKEKVARYINGLRMEIQDKLSMMSPKTTKEAYQMALKVEGKLLRKQSAKCRGTFKGKEGQGGRGGSTAPKNGGSRRSKEQEPIYGDARDKGSWCRGQGG